MGFVSRHSLYYIICVFSRYSENIATADGGTSRFVVYRSGLPEESSDSCKKPSLFTSQADVRCAQLVEIHGEG